MHPRLGPVAHALRDLLPNLDKPFGRHLTAPMNTTIANLSAAQLRRAATLKDRIQALEKELTKLLGAPASPAPTTPAKKKKTMSKAARALISAAQKERWAKIKAAKKSPK